jgi:hypothetical protein
MLSVSHELSSSSHDDKLGKEIERAGFDFYQISPVNNLPGFSFSLGNVSLENIQVIELFQQYVQYESNKTLLTRKL